MPQHSAEPHQKPVEYVPIPPPPPAQRRGRGAGFVGEGEKRDRYSLPSSLQSGSPVGYRTRISLTADEARAAMQLLSLQRPLRFVPGPGPTDQELFEESALGVLSARQSTNYRGHEQVTLGPDASQAAAHLLRRLPHLEGRVLDGASHTHVVLSKPYRTPFTMLLTFIGHAPMASLLTVPMRAWRKKYQHADDIPTIGYLQHLHVGILADAMERATVLASGNTRRANVLMAPFAGLERVDSAGPAMRELEALVGLSKAQKAQGWRIALVAQVGTVSAEEASLDGFDAALCRKLGANLLALRSERIQPGVNQEEKAPPQYHERQDMDVPDRLAYMAGRAGYNAFAHWTGLERQQAKDLLILDRIDPLTDQGKERLRSVRRELELVTDRVCDNLPLWADLPTGKALSRNAARGKKAFALAGQRIYVGGLSRDEIAAAGIGWEHAVRAFGAAAARSSLTAELAGCAEIPADCDLLAGICLMAGPVNQNDIGKQFYGMQDLLSVRHPHRDPTSLLVWTLKAKTVADPIGNEEQLLNPARKGALVDLRLAPHECCRLAVDGHFLPLRRAGEQTSTERAFHDLGNFVTDPAGQDIPGNRGEPWPRELAERKPWG